MSEAGPQIHAFVVADDPVAAGMLALDLVQAGVHAQAVAGVDALSAQLRDVAADPGRIPALLINYRTLEQASELSRHLISNEELCHVVVAVDDGARARAEQEAVLLDWLAVVHRPVDVEVVARHLASAPPFAAAREAPTPEGGDLMEIDLGQLISDVVDGDPRPLDDINAVLQLKSRGVSGSIAILGGQLVHAQAGDEQGRHALERMFCWRQGTWRLVRGLHAGPRTLSGSLRANVAAAHEYARRVDQSRASLPHLRVPCAVRWERVRPLPAVAEAMFRRIAVGMVLVDALDGEGDDELEAFAALHSRMRRGAVVPRDGQAQAERQGSVPARRRRSGSMEVATGRPMVEAAPVAEHRHAATASYWAPGDLAPGEKLPDDLPEPMRSGGRQNTPSNPILPLSLPEYDPDSGPYPVTEVQRDAAMRLLESLPSRRQNASSGWFGINVNRDEGHQDDNAVTTDLSAVQRAVVEATPSLTPPGHAERSAKVIANLARQGPPRTESEAHFADWSNDFEEKLDQEASVIEQIRPPTETGGRRTMLWLVAAAVAAGALVLVLMPGSPLFDAPGSGRSAVAEETPVVQTYRRAVALIDEGERAEARLKLRGVCGQPGVPPEAYLQLAVLEIEGGMSDMARTHLERYLDEPRAQHRERADRLYAHVFGARATPGKTP